MNEPLITVDNVTKSFCIEHSPGNSLKRAFLSSLHSDARTRKETFKAIRGISFSLGRGESLALLGNNGSGKSTLLRMLANIIKPTSGSLHVRGRVAPMIELGAGFHPDLTGEENIFLNASMYGISNRRTRCILNDIIEFADLKDFIDTPIRNYSSGMFMRLGFSIAAHTNPDLMLIDEVLAVGDAGFQNKCHDRIRKLQNEGMSLVFVSHDENLSARFCHRFLRLSQGEIVDSGFFSKG